MTATRPADAKIIFKRKAAELVIALQLPFSYIEFIAYTVHAFYIVRQIRGNPNFLSQVAYMVVDCLSGIVGVVLMPYQIQQHFIGEHPLWIQYKQSKNIKFLYCQRNYLVSHSNKTLLQAEIQITFSDFRQWLIGLLWDKILALKESCVWDISQNIASLIVTNKLGQLFLLAGRKKNKQLFTDLPAGIFQVEYG